MLYMIIFYLAFSVLFYTLFGGADFGAGILEFFRKKSKIAKSEELTNKAIGPVWEANHMWLIIAIVVLFMGFPLMYRVISVNLHIPVTALLIGIVLRGCFFTFRHYDLIQDESDVIYSRIFSISSVVSSFFIGVTAGALKLGRIDPEATDFFAAFVRPWWNVFSFSTGVFTCSLFAFMAAVYIIGENKENLNTRFLIRQALNANIAIVIAGSFVFYAAYLNDFNLLAAFIQSPSTALALTIATLILPFLWTSIKGGRIHVSRMLTAIQVFCVLFAWFWADFPEVVSYETGSGLSLYEAAAPEATLNVLGAALVLGSILILPALAYLMYTFKKPETGDAL
jgi:cytochrome d ubiquinol oxidase subunit II